MIQKSRFGETTWNLDVQISHSCSLPEILLGLTQMINFLGMDTADMDPHIDKYPIPDGRGGIGYTITQPYVEPRKLIEQSLTTSFAIIDLWPELECFTLTIKSCVQFDERAVLQEIPRIFGNILDSHYWVLGKSRNIL